SAYPRRLTVLISLFVTHTASTEIYTLSLHDALPILDALMAALKADDDAAMLAIFGDQHKNLVVTPDRAANAAMRAEVLARMQTLDRKSTRLNSSHLVISYAVFCLKKKTTTTQSKANK